MLHCQSILYLVDLLQDKNREVRRASDTCLDLIMDNKPDWADKIRNLKFQAHNQHWLEAVNPTRMTSEKPQSQVLCLNFQEDRASSNEETEFDHTSLHHEGLSSMSQRYRRYYLLFGNFHTMRSKRSNWPSVITSIELKWMQADGL